MSNNTYSRRTYLCATGSALGLSFSAGCTSTTSSETETEIPLPENGLRWIPIEHENIQLYDTYTRYASRALTDFWTNIALYEDILTEERVTELTLNGVNYTPLRVVGSLYIQTSGYTAELLSNFSGTIATQIHTEFRSQLEQRSISDITVHNTSDLSREYTGVLELDSITIPKEELPINNSLTISPDPIEIEAGFEIQSVEDDDFAGYMWIEPVGMYTTNIRTVSISGPIGEGVDITPELNLNFFQYRSLQRDQLQETVREAETVSKL